MTSSPFIPRTSSPDLARNRSGIDHGDRAIRPNHRPASTAGRRSCVSRTLGCTTNTASLTCRDRLWAFRVRRHDLVRKPDGGELHVRFDERGSRNAVTGTALRPGAKATDLPPDPKAGALASYSTQACSGTHADHHLLVGTPSRQLSLSVQRARSLPMIRTSLGHLRARANANGRCASLKYTNALT